jgi:tetratricopeptide (TPR) repeat protein
MLLRCTKNVNRVPGNNSWQSGLARAYGRVGIVLNDQRKFDEALENYQKDLTIIESLAAANRDNPNWQDIAAGIHQLMASAFEQKGDLNEAADHIASSLKSVRRVRPRVLRTLACNATWFMPIMD